MTADLDDPDGLGGFWQWYDELNPALRAQVIGPVLARLRAFLLRDFVSAPCATRSPASTWARSSTAGSCSSASPKASSARTPPGCSARSILAPVWQAATARAATAPEASAATPP